MLRATVAVLEGCATLMAGALTPSEPGLAHALATWRAHPFHAPGLDTTGYPAVRLLTSRVPPMLGGGAAGAPAPLHRSGPLRLPSAGGRGPRSSNQPAPV